MDDGLVALRARNPTLDEFFSCGQTYGSQEELNDHQWAWGDDDDEDLRRFIRGGLAAK